MKDFFLSTNRIGFSSWNESDYDEAMELWTNPNVTKYIVASGKMSEEQVLERLHKEIDTFNKFKVQYWPIYLLETGETIGCCGLRPYDLENNILELGVHLKERFWGKGLAIEACKAVIEYAFSTINVSALFAGHNPNNKVSSKLLKKLGFQYLRDEFYPPTNLNHPSYLLKKQDYDKNNISY
jgi:RimJ/RimL family protein N-acetyltransferase